MYWLLYLGLKEGPVECATLGVKSEVILQLDRNRAKVEILGCKVARKGSHSHQQLIEIVISQSK